MSRVAGDFPCRWPLLLASQARRASTTAFVLLSIVFPLVAADLGTGTVCVAPIAAQPDSRTGARIEPCPAQELFVKIDSFEPVPFSKEQVSRLPALILAINTEWSSIADRNHSNHSAFAFPTSKAVRFARL